jgi:hypothetical protein
MKYSLLLLFIPTLLFAQEFTFRQEFDTIPVEINGWQPFAPWTGGESESVPKLVDIDGDGDLDFFVGNQHGFITHYENSGTHFSANYQFLTYSFNSINLSPLPFGGYSAPKFCDLDNDGDQDLFSGDFAGLVHYWQNVGTSSSPDFLLVTDSLANIDIDGLSKMDFVDLDLDGDFDLFIGDYFGYLWYFENTGNAQTFNFSSTPVQFEGIDVGGYACPRFVDIDSDTDFDLFIGAENGRIYYYRNDGGSVNYDYTYVTDYYNNIDVGEDASPEFADIDGDGDYDLFVGRDDIDDAVYSPGDIYFYENIGTPDSARWQLITKNYLSLDEGERSLNNSTDIDADGDFEIFAANYGNALSYFTNNGTAEEAAFEWITGFYSNISVSGGKPYFSDIDSDQDPDLFLGEGIIPNPPYPGLHLYRNIGTPQNAIFTLFSNDLIPGTYFAAIYPALADIDGDDDDDIFMTDNDGIFYFAENTGTPQIPSFADPVENWQGINVSDGWLFTFYDLDDDQDLDLFFAQGYYGDTYVTFYRNSGTAQSPLLNSIPDTLLHVQSGGLFFRGIDILDIDADGDGDFFIGTQNNGGILFFRNTTGDTSAVNPRIAQHLLHGIELSFGPNPSNPVTWVTFNLPYPQKAELAVYNLLGQKVATLASGYQMPGTRTYFWNATNTSSGTYFIRLELSPSGSGATIGTGTPTTVAGKVVLLR